MLRGVVYCLLGTLVGLGCKEKKEERQTFKITYPAHFPAPLPGFDDNPMTTEGVALGKMLFMDPGLSDDSTVSCATCHREASFFSDPGRSLSTLPGREPPIRHTPALINLAWQPTFFWDGGVRNLESVSLGPLKGHREMNTNIEGLAARLRTSDTYRQMNQSAFGTDSMVTAHIFRALAQYMRSLVFTDTYYDAYKAGDYTPTQEELAGEAVFATHCAACHPPPLFTDFQFHNIGLDTITGGGDLNFLAGRARITGDAQDAGKYKTPTLRYWMHTAPFMHNGTLPDLDAVLAHYRYGVQDVPTLDAMLKKSGAKPGIALSDEEVRSIQNFLGLLNTFHDTK